MRLINRMVALFLVLLLSIESFGAVLSDNDGSAFITKAEFDSLRNDFQAQVDQYNQSIDSKIDGAIAAYLAGINVQTPPENYYARLKSAIGNKNPYFLRTTKSGANAIISQVVVSKSKHYSVKYTKKDTIKNETKLLKTTFNATWSGDLYSYFNIYVWWKGTGSTKYNKFAVATLDSNHWYVKNGDKLNVILNLWEGTTCRYLLNTNGSDTTPSFNTSQTISAGGTVNVPIENRTTKNLHLAYDDIAADELVQLAAKYKNDDKSYAVSAAPFDTSIGKAKPGGSEQTITNNFTLDFPVISSSSRNGSGSQWTYESNPDGTKSLKRYWTTFYPQQLITLNYKNYKDGGTVTEVIEGAFKETTANTYTPSIEPNYGRVAVGTNHTSYGTQNNVGYCEEIFSLMTSSDDTTDYRTAQWGLDTANNIYASTESPTLVNKSNNLNTYTDLAASTVTIGGVLHATTKVTNNVKEVTINPETLPLNTFVNTYYTGIAGEPVRMGYGIPIMRANADLGTRYNIKVKMKMIDLSTGNAVVGDVNCRLSNNHFVDCNFATTADKLYESTYNLTSTVENTLTIPLDNIPKGQQVWLNLFSVQGNRKVELTGFDVTIS